MTLDIMIYPNDVFVKVEPLSIKAEKWIEDNIGNNGYHPEYPTLYIEHQFADDILYAMKDYGLKGDVKII